MLWIIYDKDMQRRKGNKLTIVAKKSFPKKIILGAGTAVIFIPLLLFVIRSYLSYQAIVTQVAQAAPSPEITQAALPTSGSGPHFTFNPVIAGIRDNTLVLYDSDTGLVTKTAIPLRSSWSYRLSPDKTKIFISTFQTGSQTLKITFSIYDMHGNKLYTASPVLENGFDTVGIQTGNSRFESSYFAWDESGQGVLYVTSKLLTKHEDAGESNDVQFRYISTTNKTDTLMYETTKDSTNDENILLGFNYITKKITMADVVGPIIDAKIYSIDIAAQTKTPITHLLSDSTTIPLWREISPDQSQIVGKLSNLIDQKNITATPTLPFTLIFMNQPDRKIDILPNLDITESETPQGKTAEIFFINNDTAALYYPFIDNRTPRYNVELLNTTTQHVTLGFGTDQLLDPGNPVENISPESLVDINSQNLVVTTENVIRGGVAKKLPDTFIPIGFVSL
jgi:hypothetical protein